MERHNSLSCSPEEASEPYPEIREVSAEYHTLFYELLQYHISNQT